MGTEKKLTSKLEDYLLTVYRLERETRVARPRDIGRRRKVAKSTVTSALRSLAENGLVNYEPYEAVTLTVEGKKQAESLTIRNHVLRDFLEDILGFPPEEARSAACGMEHALDSTAVDRFVCFLAYIKHGGHEIPRWIEEFRDCAKEGSLGESSAEYVQKYLQAMKVVES
ncbi:MAG: metal-dependent transcriptional regulator [Candidatus Krumholzibacteria bacterium]|nr:metal-dependent transcriptional regulator [Candidatus Krumholzibacteria bacterium]